MMKVEPVFCICRQPDDHTLMLQCNYCDEWYHARCLQMTAEQVEQMKEYECAACRAKKSVDTADLKSRQAVKDGLASALSFVENPADYASAVEQALYEANSQSCNPAYRSKYRSILFNLKDPKNDRLRGKLKDGQIQPAVLVQMSPAELANEELQEQYRQHDNVIPVKPKQIKATEYTTEVENVDLDRRPLAKTQPEFMNVTWSGLVMFPEICCFPAQISSSLPATLKQSLPHNFHVTGRISPAKATDYLHLVGSNRWLAVPLEAGKDSEPFINYLRQHQRWAVIVTNPLMAAIKDLYLVESSMMPVKASTDLSLIIVKHAVY